MRSKIAITALSVLSAAALVAGCSSSKSSNGGSGGGDNSRGPITFVSGKDNSGTLPFIADKWNAAHPNEKVTIKQQSDQADQQLSDLEQHFQAKDAGYDVASVDVVWTAEFAAKGWLQPLKDKMALDTSALLKPTVEAASYKGTLYAAPESSDGGILYYRKDLVPTPPKTWDEMMSMCSIAKTNNIGCYSGQFKKYEGLTVNASEAINSAGGAVLDENGKPNLLTAEAKAGMANLTKAYADGSIPKEAITFQEEESRQAFQDGKLLFLRNWPYVYNLATTEGSSKVKDVLGMTALPGKTGPGASSLGGHSAAISVYSKNKATAVDFLKFLTTEETQKFFATQGSLAPVLGKLYDDKELVAKLPYLPVLKTSIENAVPRPVTPFYPAVTKAIQENAYSAIKGEKTVDAALSDMQKSIESASAGQ